MKLPTEIDTIIDKITAEPHPLSVFLYGSRARGDFEPESDYEIGLIFAKNKRWNRAELRKLHSLNNLSLYSFSLDQFKKYTIDIPFQNAFFFRELIQTAQTVSGKKIVETMTLPAISTIDCLESISFQIGMAVSALLSSRQLDWITASSEFAKSVLFGTRVMIVLKLQMFPLDYSEIVQQAKKIGLDQKYLDLISHAAAVRKGTPLDPSKLYTNISFLNQVVLQEVKQQLKNGDSILIPSKQR